MKALTRALVMLLGLSAGLAAQDASAAQPKYITSNFAPHAGGYRVTIESAGGLVATLEVPDGVFLSLTGPAYPEPGESALSGRRFRGNVTIRTRRDDEREEGESNLADAIMAKSPLEVSLEDVIVEVVIPGEEG